MTIIDRAKLIYDFENLPRFNYGNGEMIKANQVRNLILDAQKLSLSDIIECGEWKIVLDETTERLKCSNCGNYLEKGCKKSNFCPNCGALMERIIDNE